MKTPGEAAMELPWLAPSVASLTALVRSPLAACWEQVRSDPGLVILAASITATDQSGLPADVPLLDAVLYKQSAQTPGFVDWHRPGLDWVHRVCQQHGLSALRLAEKIGCDQAQAWIAGFLAPLGWIGVAAADPRGMPRYLEQLKADRTNGWQRQTWGHDHAALLRRLCRAWNLPAWLTTILSHLNLSSDVAARLGAEPRLFQIVQLTARLLEERGHGLGLVAGEECAGLLRSLRLSAGEAGSIADAVVASELPVQVWESPAQQPLLFELLRLTLYNRRRNDSVWIERLQEELDHLHDALVQQSALDTTRLEQMKLSALAEFAAGAGHEINNPLAVISGQAQYVLKQMDWLSVPADEIENVGAYLENLRAKVAPSLQKIIGQTGRIHSILTELMQYARPNPPRLQVVSIQSLIQETVQALEEHAGGHEVRVEVPLGEREEFVLVDPAQTRTALSGLVRNAIEAAPSGGWARIRVEINEQHEVEISVEDNGAGPSAAVRGHMFDPFYSGRSAGRGRGMGLPVAWRLACQQGGEVRFVGASGGVTRFVMTLPLAVHMANSSACARDPAFRQSAAS